MEAQPVTEQNAQATKLLVSFQVVLLPTFFVAAAKLSPEPKTDSVPVSDCFLVVLAAFACLCSFNARTLQVFDEAAQTLLYHLINSGASPDGSQVELPAPAGDSCNSLYILMLQAAMLMTSHQPQPTAE